MSVERCQWKGVSGKASVGRRQWEGVSGKASAKVLCCSHMKVHGWLTKGLVISA